MVILSEGISIHMDTLGRSTRRLMCASRSTTSSRQPWPRSQPLGAVIAARYALTLVSLRFPKVGYPSLHLSRLGG